MCIQISERFLANSCDILVDKVEKGGLDKKK